MLLLHIAQSYEPQMINGDRRRDGGEGEGEAEDFSAFPVEFQRQRQRASERGWYRVWEQ